MPPEEKSRRARRRIHSLLLHEWDAIGVSGRQGAEDEYDSYGDKAFVMLALEGVTAEQVAQYLFRTERDFMRLGERADAMDRCRRVAHKLDEVVRDVFRTA